MTRAAKICSSPDCPNLQPCPDHTPKAWAGSTRRSRLPKGWAKLRDFVLRRDPFCKDGRVCEGKAPSTVADHIVPGDDHRLSNLQGICEDCHERKTLAEAAEARARR